MPSIDGNGRTGAPSDCGTAGNSPDGEVIVTWCPSRPSNSAASTADCRVPRTSTRLPGRSRRVRSEGIHLLVLEVR
ncbi:hypothetical protein [Streptomyces sp. C36]|uniref:hypothetical protein n=1 Tax=Streptomyces sp. C36 TaxID=3237122 RepID=UPI0034C5D657